LLDELRSRVKDVDLLDKVMDAEDAVRKFVAGSKALAKYLKEKGLWNPEWDKYIAKEMIPKLVKASPSY
jgi:hypothetical protein